MEALFIKRALNPVMSYTVYRAGREKREQPQVLSLICSSDSLQGLLLHGWIKSTGKHLLWSAMTLTLKSLWDSLSGVQILNLLNFCLTSPIKENQRLVHSLERPARYFSESSHMHSQVWKPIKTETFFQKVLLPQCQKRVCGWLEVVVQFEKKLS